MLIVKIEKGSVRVQQNDGSLDMVLSAQEIRVDVAGDPGFTFNLIGNGPTNASKLGSESQATPMLQRSRAEEIARLLTSTRSAKSTKTAPDYIEEVFRQLRLPMTSKDLSVIIFELTDFKSTAKNQVNNMRSTMQRESPERFKKYDNHMWILTEIEDELKSEGKLPWLEEGNAHEGNNQTGQAINNDTNH